MYTNIISYLAYYNLCGPFLLKNFDGCSSIGEILGAIWQVSWAITPFFLCSNIAFSGFNVFANLDVVVLGFVALYELKLLSPFLFHISILYNAANLVNSIGIVSKFYVTSLILVHYLHFL